MPNYKMTIAYDGTRYNGWQKQGNTKNTIQGRLEYVIRGIIDEAVEVHGSGRTDAGAHAKGQVANFTTKRALNTEKFVISLNKRLGGDIAILEMVEVNERFHSRLNAKRKTYEYIIWNSTTPNVFQGRYMFQSGNNLDIEKMEEAAKLFVGEKDFKSFCSNRRYKKSTVREIYDINVKKAGAKITLTFVGDGFLYNMVRIIAGTILQAGEGKIELDQIPAMIDAKNRDEAGVTIPAEGLTLVGVEY